MHLINKYSESIQTYFPKLGDNIIIINGIGSDVQERMNSQDLDSDSCYVTNQTDVVNLAKKAYMEYSTIVNEIPLTGVSAYSKDMTRNYFCHVFTKNSTQKRQKCSNINENQYFP